MFSTYFRLLKPCIKLAKKPYKSRENRLNYLLDSSIATATATCHISNRSGNSTMGLLPALDNRRIASLQAPLVSKSVKIAPRALSEAQRGA